MVAFPENGIKKFCLKMEWTIRDRKNYERIDPAMLEEKLV